ncbi:strictosidine synthase [Nocardioides szechwanensis]|uniref:SMP-30/Gluconolaconase/LRE-like region-containing protein n=1 Tax=Nocardioides szechwanensis TaxID=1005944 RepID=A0A1G9W318_9ACTN|nr:SMP-30/gluconolactonase/LRE family protein [Nocardioides szechwanensis]GEP32767.1 strictosidine synthase [Nocardioides szechwanensis]SDM78607.1 SMP-30/Gluconolaconase/LRE-like region-containing protein [Nocardioides szechwanensis]
MTFSVIPVPGSGAEDVVVATSGPDEGAVFTGTEDGAIFRVSHDGRKVDRVADTGGRPLGIELDVDGRLLVCDARRGLLRVDTASGAVEAVTDSVNGTKMVFCNNAAVASDGTVWFSDSSTKYGIDQWKDDFVQNTRTGRLMKLSTDGTIEVVLDGLAFANGVALSAAEDFVCVAETGARTVVRRWLTGNRAGMRDLLCQGLPGYPDNIARGTDGLIWITIASPIDPLVERLQTGPMPLRKLVTKIPERLQPKPKQTVRVQAYDETGVLVHDIDVRPADHGAAYHMVTGVREHDGRVWMGSLHEPAVAVLDR